MENLSLCCRSVFLAIDNDNYTAQAERSYYLGNLFARSLAGILGFNPRSSFPYQEKISKRYICEGLNYFYEQSI